MNTDRDYDVWMLEIQMANEKLEREWLMEKLGKRAQRMQNAGTAEEQVAGPAQEYEG